MPHARQTGLPTLPALLLALLLGLPAQADDKTEARYRAALTHARETVRYLHLRHGPGVQRMLDALGVRPDGQEALLELAELWPSHRPAILRAALRLRPTHETTVRRVKAVLGSVPEVRKYGRASRIEALATIHAWRDALHDDTASIAVGETLPLRRLLVHGVDADGNIVPVDPAFEPGKGLRATDGGFTADAPTRRAELRVRDRKSGATTTIPIRVVGPATRLKLEATATRVGLGGQTHVIAYLYDDAGNRLYYPRLIWSASSAQADVSPRLARRYSVLHANFQDQYHVNSLDGPRTPKDAGTQTIQVIEPTSGARTQQVITLVPERLPRVLKLGKIRWLPPTPGTMEAARKAGKPLMIFLHAEW